MKQFKMRLDLAYYDSFKEFMEAEAPGQNDFILTTEPIYNAFVKPVNPACKTLFIETYGKGEPSTAMIDQMRGDLPASVSRLIAIGGGSVMDIAKILSLKADGNTEDIFLGRVKPQKVCDVIAVPTTCGTGSEVTNACACEIISLKTKRGLNLEEIYPHKSILIPELIQGLPYQFFATSSIDALIHAIESFLSPKANPHTALFSTEAIRMIMKGYQYIIEAGLTKWVDKAEDFIIASNFAGIAFCNAGCAAVHALSYPLGGGYHIPHGEANQLMLAEVLRKYKAKKPIGKLNQLEDLFSQVLSVPRDEAIECAIALFDKVLPRKPLREYGIKKEEFRGFAEGVIQNQQRLLTNNYVELTCDDMVEIYEKSDK